MVEATRRADEERGRANVLEGTLSDAREEMQRIERESQRWDSISVFPGLKVQSAFCSYGVLTLSPRGERPLGSSQCLLADPVS